MVKIILIKYCIIGIDQKVHSSFSLRASPIFRRKRYLLKIDLKVSAHIKNLRVTHLMTRSGMLNFLKRRKKIFLVEKPKGKQENKKAAAAKEKYSTK